MLHNVADDKRSAFAGRLKHLQRMGFPPGVNTGRGRPAKYEPSQLFFLAVIFELNQFGVGPEKAAHMTDQNIHTLADGAIRALTETEEHQRQIVCNFPARALADLSNEPVDEMFIQCFTFQEAREAMEMIGKIQAGSRIAMFSLSGLINLLANLWPENKDGEFRDGLLAWARETKKKSPLNELQHRFEREISERDGNS